MLKVEIDVQLQIQANLEDLFLVHHTTINTRHVKGNHENKGKNLTCAEELNVLADYLVSESMYRTKPQPNHFPSQVVGVCVGGRQITSKYKDTLRLQ